MIALTWDPEGKRRKGKQQQKQPGGEQLKRKEKNRVGKHGKKQLTVVAVTRERWRG